MTTITLFKIEPLLEKEEIIKKLNEKKKNGCWLKARESKYNENEIEIDIWYEEDALFSPFSTWPFDAYYGKIQFRTETSDV